jgi:hypothetical protein
MTEMYPAFKTLCILNIFKIMESAQHNAYVALLLIYYYIMRMTSVQFLISYGLMIDNLTQICLQLDPLILRGHSQIPVGQFSLKGSLAII